MKKKLVKRKRNNKVSIKRVVAFSEYWPLSFPDGLNF